MYMHSLCAINNFVVREAFRKNFYSILIKSTIKKNGFDANKLKYRQVKLFIEL